MAIFPQTEKRAGLAAVLDVGTAKVCCVIAALEPAGPTLMGLGHQRSRGVKSGMIVDAGEAERAIRAAVGQAERMAGVSLDQVAIAVNCGRLRSQTFVARGPVEGAAVREPDMDRVLAGAEAYLDRSGRSAIQLMRSDWQLDGAAGIADPRGLAGREIAVELTAVTGDDGPVRNLLGAVEKSHLAVERLAAAPYASALATATDEERRLGTVVVDLGAGVTSFAAFLDGRLVHLDSVPVGGNHVTFDIARALVTSVQEAERIKTLYGTLVKAASNESEVFAYPVAGEDEGAVHQTSKAFVAEIVKPRIDALIDLVLERVAGAGLSEVA
ncbi:MAG: cell division protein FtsA, partial [Proteobacteria bacterium]|nr:cell division protein FtsA [Pseudomonadota bacterium]